MIRLFNTNVITPIKLFLFSAIYASTILNSYSQNLTAPGLVYPKNQMVLSDSVILFSWNKNFYTNLSYHIQISDSSNFTNLIINKQGLATSVYSDSTLPVSGTQYFWRVRAEKGVDTSNWSATQTFVLFSPANINGLSVWLDPTKNLVLNGTNVQSWNDQSGNGNNASQATSSARPLYINSDSLINNQPSINYNGTSNFLAISDAPSINFSTEMSIFVLVKPYVILKRESILVKWAYQTEGSWGFQTDNTTNNQLVFFVANSLNDAGGNWVNTSKANMAIKYAFLNLVYNGNLGLTQKVNFYKNFNLLTSDNVNNSINSQLIKSTANLNIGMFGGSVTRYYNGDIGEIIIYNQALNDTLRNMVDQYLLCKYSPPVNLGRDTILINNSFCGNIPLKAQFHYMHYLWSNGDTTSSIKISSAGKYWVTVTDQFGFTSSDTIVVNLPLQFNQLPKNNYLCSKDTLVWNTGYPKSKYTFLWQDGSTDSLFNITHAGQYHVRIKDASNCYFYSDTINVTIDNFSTIASLGPDTTLCSGDAIYLKSGANQALTYSWSDGSTGVSLPIYSSGQYSLTATDIQGCIKKDTINIIINGVAPTVDFLFDTVCFGNNNHFTDLSSPPSGNSITSRFWNFGDLDTLTTSSLNLIHTYADTGVYFAKLTVTTDVGCANEKTHVIHVYPYPKINITTTNPNLCEAYLIQFTSNGNTYGYPITTWNWNFDDPSSNSNNISTLQNPSHTFASTATYTIQLIAQNAYGCKDSTTDTLFIQPSPKANFNYSLACMNNVVQFTDETPPSSLFNIQGYFWNFNDLSTSGLPNPIHTFSNNQTYNVSYRVTASDGCIDSIIVPITVYPVPNVTYTYTNACINSPVNFSDGSTITSGNLVSWLWNFGDNTTSTSKTPQHTFNDTINALVKLIVTSNQGCIDSLTQTVNIHPAPVAGFNTIPPYGSPPLQVNFNNISTGATTYLWNIDATTNSSFNTAYTFNDTGTFSVSLNAVNNFGCIGNSTQTVEVTEENIDIAVKNVTTTFQNNYWSVSAQIINNSSMDVTSMNIYLKVNEITEIEVNWTGLLVKGGLLLYNFPSNIYLNDSIHFVCLSALNPNGLTDEIPDNNQSCAPIETSLFEVMDPYPNPTSEQLTLPIVIPENSTLTITLYNALGQRIRNIYSNTINKGLQLIVIDLPDIETGVYSLKIEYGSQFKYKRIIIN